MILIAPEQFGRPSSVPPWLGRQGLFAWFPDTHRRLNAHRIFQLKRSQAGAKLTVTAVGCICQNDTARGLRLHCLAYLIEGNPWLGLKLNFCGDACLFPARVIVGPTLRQIQPVGYWHAQRPRTD